MQVTETLSAGLKRELQVVVPATDIGSQLDAYLDQMKRTVRINGFRPGKVPVAHLKRVYGKSAMIEILNKIVGETVRNSIAERGERPALQPDVNFAEGVLDAAVDGGADLVFSVVYETLPEIPAIDYSSVSVERPVVPVTDEMVDEEIKRFAEGTRPFEARAEDAAAESGDKVTIDFVGRVDGETFEGGSAEGTDLVLGSNRFIPGFEEQLVGVKVGETRQVNVTFPEDYGAAHLAGKAAVFDVTAKAIAAPGAPKEGDELATALGMESMDKLKEFVRSMIEERTAGASRQLVKRALLDALDTVASFEVPESLVKSEFEAIWNQLEREMVAEGKTFADEETTEEAAKADYGRIAERRIRLGLVLSDLGEKNNVQVSDEELQRALYQRVRQFPGQEREVFEFYQKNANALASLRAPIYEDKVIDQILGLVTVTEKPVTTEELQKLVEEAEKAEAAGGEKAEAEATA
ncbi:trigger factor [Segnochrobactraceae bacterium EtOH-i3]